MKAIKQMLRYPAYGHSNKMTFRIKMVTVDYKRWSKSYLKIMRALCVCVCVLGYREWAQGLCMLDENSITEDVFQAFSIMSRRRDLKMLTDLLCAADF